MRFERKRTRAALAAAAALPLVAGALVLGAQSASADQTGRQLLSGTKPAWATAKTDKGSTADTSKVTVRVYLAGKDATGLAAYAKAVSDPNSAEYGKYLTPAQTQSQYGATQGQIAEITGWLTSAGLKVTGSTQNYLTVTGDVAAAEKAFGTQLHNFTKDGHTYRAPATTASAPASLQGAVLTVSGLDNAPKKSTHDDTLPPPADAFVNSGPFSSYYGSKTNTSLPDAYGTKAPYAIQGYTGEQLRAAYGAGKYTGKGVTVAITDAYASPTIAADASQYAKNTGGKAYKTGQLSQVLPDTYTNTADCDAAGWYGEESLDVEAVHAVAPDANIVYVGGASCMDSDLLDALTKVVDNHLADIVSNSWGDIETNETPDVAAAYDQVFQQGAVEGIGFYFSSGDAGDNVASTPTHTKQVDTPSNSPWATSVGGTSLAVGKNDTYKFETGWGTQKGLLSADGTSWATPAFTSGAGGGTSALYKQPFYQAGVVPSSLSLANGGTTKMRVEPDISAVADPNTGFLMGQTQTFADGTVKYSQYRIGGTSLASPVIAAIQADAEQARGGRSIGFANPLIYSKSGTSAYHDVTDYPYGPNVTLSEVRVDYVNTQNADDGTTTSLRVLGRDSSLKATRGYDDVTGVGTPTSRYVSLFGGRG
jgi:subtilase family serine protease